MIREANLRHRWKNRLGVKSGVVATTITP